MSEKEPQTYANHGKFVPFYHFVISLILLVQLGRSGWGLFRDPGLGSVLNLALAVALLGIWLYARIFALKVQDRLIRLEMRLRLKEVLPEELQGKIPALTVDDMVALRFAGDDELPDLVRRVLAGELKGRKAIKQQVRNWQADHARC